MIWDKIRNDDKKHVDDDDDDDGNDDDYHTDHASIREVYDDDVSHLINALSIKVSSFEDSQQLRIVCRCDTNSFILLDPSLSIDLILDRIITHRNLLGECSKDVGIKRRLFEKMVSDGDDDYEATKFDGSEYLNDKEDSDTRLEPGRHKKNSEEVDDDDDDMEEKKDDKKDDDDDGNDDDDHTNHASIKDQVSGSQQLRIEKMQTPIPSPPRSLRIDLSSDKDITH
ncbi:hypothetical protein Tco_0375092 [Tanacetum coccineum]